MALTRLASVLEKTGKSSPVCSLTVLVGSSLLAAMSIKGTRKMYFKFLTGQKITGQSAS